MKIFDFNIHLPANFLGVEGAIHSELQITPNELLRRYQEFIGRASFIDGTNVMIFNQEIFNYDMSHFLPDGIKVLPNTHFTFLLNPRLRDPFELIEECLIAGIKSFKYHSYIQRIDDALIAKCVEIAQFIQQKGGVLCIDASYGTLQMLRYDNIRLICEVALKCKKMPIVILHSGGIQVLKAMLAVLDSKNLYMETSFTLPTFLGSSVECDLAFAYKAIGSERIIYASDSPYVDAKLSLDTAMAFFDRNGFRGSELESIFYGNAVNILRAS